MADEGDNNALPVAHQVPHLAFNFKPPSFDGTQTDSARKWLQKFELYADLAGAAVEGRCGLMGLLLTGLAETWYNSLTEQQRTDYEQLREAFTAKFIAVPATAMQRQLSTIQRTQQASESVDAYFTETRAKLAEHNFPAQLSISLLINGLRPDIKTLVLQHQPFAGIDDLIDKARHIEAALKSTPTPSTTSAFNAIAREDLMVTMGDLDRAKKDMVDELSKTFQTMQTRSRPTTPVSHSPDRQRRVRFRDNIEACFTCGRTSHFARNCPFDRRGSDRPRPPTPFPRNNFGSRATFHFPPTGHQNPRVTASTIRRHRRLNR